MKHLITSILILTLSGCAWSTTDKALLVTSWMATGADYYTTKRILDDGGYELNPLIGKHPSNSRLAIHLLTTQILVTAIAYWFPKYRTEILGAKTLISVGLAKHNSGE